MSLKAVIATLVLGSSSVALANPEIRDHRAPAPVELQVTSHATAQWYRPIPLPPTPAPVITRTVLADEAKLSGPRTKIAIGDKKLYTGLELRADGRGRVNIDRVVIYFGNNTTQVVDVNTTLTSTSAPFVIDLVGKQRHISSIEIVSSRRGAARGRRNGGLDIVGVDAA